MQLRWLPLALLAAVHTALCDHYSTLGIDKTATTQQIKKSYRKLAMKHHPDKSRGDKATAEKKFAKIAEAYEVLSDPKKRQEYDNPPEQMPGVGGGGGAQPFFFRSGGNTFFHRGSHHPHMGQFASSAGRFDFAGNSGFDFADDDMTSMLRDIFAQQQGGHPKQPRGASPQPHYHPGGDVRILTRSSFQQVTRSQRGDAVWLIHFHAGSSHGCRRLAPALVALAASLKGLVTVGAVACDTQPSLCERQQITTTPTIKLLGPGTVETLTKGGQLSQASLAKMALDRLPSHVVSLRRLRHVGQFFEHCRATASDGCVLLFTDKYETPPLYKRLSSVWRHRLSLGEVQAAHSSEIAAQFEVRSFPTVLYLRDGSATPEMYRGEPKFAALDGFLRTKVARG